MITKENISITDVQTQDSVIHEAPQGKFAITSLAIATAFVERGY